MILIIDNYDSFTFNLYQYVGKYKEVLVKRNDDITLKEIEELKPEGIIISPGPGEPKDSGVCKDVIRSFKGEIPILGVCLGHQAIGEVFGGEVIRANEIFHGKSSVINIKKSPIFNGLESKVEVMRYHSLIIKNNTMSEDVEIIGETEKGEIMALAHKKYKVFGVQFHPESIFTKCGERILKNFVEGICNGC
ncbi:MAG: anthranilate synthase component II [Clostridium sp.]